MLPHVFGDFSWRVSTFIKVLGHFSPTIHAFRHGTSLTPTLFGTFCEEVYTLYVQMTPYVRIVYYLHIRMAPDHTFGLCVLPVEAPVPFWDLSHSHTLSCHVYNRRFQYHL